MDRHLKKVAKTDEFQEQLQHGIQFFSGHTAEVKKYGVVGLAVLLVAGGIYFFVHHQGEVREQALADALQVDDATVGNNPQPASKHFDTQEQKDQALNKAFTELETKYHGSQEGAIAELNLAQAAADKGDTATAEAKLKDLVASAPVAYASQAALTLADLYKVQGKYAEAEKLLNDLVKNPSVTVSKEEAEVALARIWARSDPEKARKKLEELRSLPNRPAISKAAQTALGEMATGGVQ